MNAEEIVADEALQEVEDNPSPESEASDAFAPMEPPKGRFGALLKAIEIWVQTR
jgi:hypothetical protein